VQKSGYAPLVELAALDVRVVRDLVEARDVTVSLRLLAPFFNVRYRNRS
jgi:hypothetical protein